MSFIKRLLEPSQKNLEQIDVEVFDGVKWFSLNDKIYYRLGARTLGDTTQTKNRLSSTSTLFDGEWIFHSTNANVTETIEVRVASDRWSEIAAATDALIEAFSQNYYEVRITIDDYREVWRCFPADYTISRSHTQLHAFQQTVTFSVPRLPSVTQGELT